VRHIAWAVAGLVGCATPDTGSQLVVSPGPVATVSPGALLQIEAHFEPRTEATYALTIDDAAGALFDTKTITEVEGGAIISLVPACGAPPGFVTFHLQTTGPERELDLAIAIGDDMLGACAGGAKHAITRAQLDVVQPRKDGALCTRVTANDPPMYDRTREVVRVVGATGTTARANQLICNSDSLRVELWPPIDAPVIEHIGVETLACRTDGCDPALSVSACCEASPERTTLLTTQVLALPVTSPDALLVIGSGGVSTVGCADLDANGTPELFLDSGRVFVGAEGRFSIQNVAPMTAVRGFRWQSAGGVSEPVIIGADATGLLLRGTINAGLPAWVSDPRFDHVAALVHEPLEKMFPVSMDASSGASYLAWFSGLSVTLACISDACAGVDVSMTAGSEILAAGVVDIDGNGTNDIVIATKPGGPQEVGALTVNMAAFLLDWSGSAMTAASPQTAFGDPVVLPKGAIPIIEALPGTSSVGACERIEIAGGGVLVELETSSCAPPYPYVPSTKSTVGRPLTLSRIEERLVVPTPLGVFSLGYRTDEDAVWALQDPLLVENALIAGQTLVDNSSSAYGTVFATCVGDAPSFVFETITRALEWTELDIPVEPFSAGVAP